VPVPRGTPAEASPPPLAVALLGDRAHRLEPYARLLAGPGRLGGLLGPREVPRLWERHLLNCAAVADKLPAGRDVMDVGSGAGLPGLVWALLRPDLRLTLVEPQLRRTAFLDQVIGTLALPNVSVVRARAEDLAGRLDADLVAARAVAPLARLVGWCLPLVRPGGQLWALKGRMAADELVTARAALQRGGATDVVVATYGEGVLESPTTVVQVSV